MLRVTWDSERKAHGLTGADPSALHAFARGTGFRAAGLVWKGMSLVAT